jgi:hypothetical protein
MSPKVDVEEIGLDAELALWEVCMRFVWVWVRCLLITDFDFSSSSPRDHPCPKKHCEKHFFFSGTNYPC